MKNKYNYKFPLVEKLARESEENLAHIDRQKLSVSEDFVEWKGGSLKMKIKESGFIQKLCYLLRIDYIIHAFSASYKNDVQKALKTYLSEEELNDNKLVTRIKKDMRSCDKLIMAKPYEYFFLNLRNKTKQERVNFITDKYMLQRMSICGNRRTHDIELNEKYNFYLLAKPFFKRVVLLLNRKTSFEAFEKEALMQKKMIFKPSFLGCGGGIFIADVSTSQKARKVFDKVVSYGGNWVAEELIVQAEEMANWNVSSVNTVRLLSFCTDDGIKFTTSFIRTGRDGAVVDNGGAGGIFAAIDEDSGKIITDGFDEFAHLYVCHPNSNIKYKGWQVPYWEELKETAIAVHSTVFPDMKYIGWDFALTEKGWVLIEGNWGQFLQQAPLGFGLRNVFDNYVK